MLDDQRALRRTIDSLQDQLAQERAQRMDGGTGAPPPSSPGPGPDVPNPVPAQVPGQSGIEAMMARLASLENMMKEDNGRAVVAPPTLDAVAAQGSGIASTTAPGSLGSVANDELIAELERAAQNPHGVFLRQLKKFREVSPWPMPLGYRQRLAPSYLCQVYKSGQSGVEYARRWMQAHSLQNCSPAQEMISVLSAVDDALLSDGADVINSVTFEKLCRRAYGLERAYEECTLEEHWRRPENRKSWKSRVKWDLCDQYDVRSVTSKGTRIPVADQEAREVMEREASFAKYYSKMAEAKQKEQGSQ